MDSETLDPNHIRDAGDFEDWLHDLLHSFTSGHGTNVPCGDCRACCSSGYFIPVSPDETKTISAISADALFHSPRHPTGDVLLIGLTKSGRCSLLKNKQCSIYRARPQACRDYDCRLFAAAGIDPEIPEIDKTIRKWRFSYRSDAAVETHAAIRTAAKFLRTHSADFPSGKAPQKPDEVAITAIKAHGVFKNSRHTNKSKRSLISEYIEACKYYEENGRIWEEQGDAGPIRT